MKRLFISLLTLCVAFLPFLSGEVQREEEAVFYYQNKEGYASYNVNDHDYGYYWSEVTNSHLYEHNGQFVRVEYCNGEILVEYYSSDFQLISTRTIERQLSLYGGFFHGEKYNFLVFGQENPNDSADAEVIRVVKYSQDWEELGHYSSIGANTHNPFEAGNCSLFEKDGLLYIRTCHTMFMSTDGYNHQANLHYLINEEDMNCIEAQYDVIYANTGYVSHSFNQMQCFDDNYYYGMDHGDAYPRGIMLSRMNYGSLTVNIKGNVYTIKGNTGDNYTGVEIGGFQKAGNNLLTTIKSVNMSNYENSTQKNIILLVTPSDKISESYTSKIAFTSYSEDAAVEVGNPQLVKINENRLLLMWTEYSEEGYWTSMVLIDSNGNILGKQIRCGVRMSDCQPIVVDDCVFWYVTDGSFVTFYKIDCSSDTALNRYDGQEVVLWSDINSLLSDYEWTHSRNSGQVIINLEKYIGTSEATDLKKYKEKYHSFTFGISSNTYGDNDILKKVVLSDDITYLPYSCFHNCRSLEEVTMDRISEIRAYAFRNCTSLKHLTVPAGVERIDYGAFTGCEKLEEIDFRSDRIKVTQAVSMFTRCSSLKHLDLRGFDLSECKSAYVMFAGCESLEDINFEGVRFAGTTDMGAMFSNCRSLFELDLTGFDTSEVTYMSTMFSGCTNLKKLYVSDSFVTDKVTSSDNMFTDAVAIEGGNGTVYSADHTDKEYARIDSTSAPGYFSARTYIEEWKWSGDYTSATVELKNSNGSVAATCNAEISVVNTEPDCTHAGKKYYTAKAVYQGKSYYDQQIVNDSQPLGHDYQFDHWVWGYNFESATAYFICAHDPTHTKTVSGFADIVLIEPDCTHSGKRTYTVTINVDGKEYTNYHEEIINATGHNLEFEKIVWRDDCSAYAQCHCSKCNSPVQVECKIKVVSTTAATCNTYGDTTYEASVEIKGKTYTDTKSVTNQLLRHEVTSVDYNWSADYSTVTAVRHCSRCDGFSETVSTTSEITVQPGCNNDGEMVYTAVFETVGFETQTRTVRLSRKHNYVFVGFDYSESWARAKYQCSSCQSVSYIYATQSTQTTSATCETEGGTVTKVYVTAEKSLDGRYHEETKEDTVPALGHLWQLSYWNWNSVDPYKTTAVFQCSRNYSHYREVPAEVSEYINARGNTVYVATVTLDGKTYSRESEVKKTAAFNRVYGNNRYETSLYAANYLRLVQGVDLFDSVVVTTGQAFPDALSGSYLANLYNAPVILIRADKARDVRNYIKNNLKSGGNVFILGGVNAVPDEWLSGLKGFNIERIAGSNRYGTNIEVLNKAGYKGGDILVCVGTNFADSLSCSAVDMPMMLVGDALKDDQKAFLGKCSDVRFHIIGGTSAVSSAVEKELKQYGKVRERIAGNNRFHTSELIAEKFFDDPLGMVMAYGRNFPDGLSGGPIAYAIHSPLLLTEDASGSMTFARSAADMLGTYKGVVLGGPGLISDKTAYRILNSGLD